VDLSDTNTQWFKGAVMKLRFEWDEKKAKANLKKHRVDFDEATTVFTDKIEQLEDNDMRNEYDFRGGVRGKHHKALQAGYTVTLHKADGTTVVKDVAPKKM